MLQEANLTVNLEKTNSVQPEVKFLGLIISAKDIRPDPGKIDAIQQFPAPTKLKQLRGFLGLCNFYLQIYTKITNPITKLLKKGYKWKWGPEEQAAFEDTKKLFLESVLLSHPKGGKPYFLQTDSSGYELGGVLYQEDNDGEPLVILAEQCVGPS